MRFGAHFEETNGELITPGPSPPLPRERGGEGRGEKKRERNLQKATPTCRGEAFQAKVAV